MNIRHRLKNFAKRLRDTIRPSETAWTGASKGVMTLAGVMLAGLLVIQIFADFTFQKLAGFAVITLALILAGALGRLLFRLIQSLNPVYRASLFVFAPLIMLLLMPGTGPRGAALAAVLILVVSLVGAGVAVLREEGFRPRDQKVTLVAAGSGLLIFIIGSYVIFSSGEPANPALTGFSLDDRTLDLSNPGLPGDYPILTLTYGSGKDRQRPEYGEDVDLVSRSVDGSKLIDNWDGPGGWLRTSYWGFDTTELPLQARVWYPDATGPFPLILVVHGNHGMEDFSEPGYDYLGELFAGRGYIFTSVDENFLNSSISDVVDIYEEPGLEEENDARGWMLLEHLALWREWSDDPENPFYKKVDMERVGLIGHSRGGEAVGVAAAFNQLDRYPDDATLEFDYRFNLKGVIAIAPADGQYKPRERGTPIRNVNYFTIHGSMDGDVQSFMGTSQYSRVSFSDPSGDEIYRFKSSLYVVGANHGQFNTSWGRIDVPDFWGWMLDTGPIMDPEAQRNIAKVYFSAFFEVAMFDRHEYLPIFSDARYAARWLPDTFYLNQYAVSGQQVIADFEEDIDPATASLKGARIESENLTKWRESWIELKWRPLDTHVAIIAWDDRVHENPGRLEIVLPEDWGDVGADGVLTFSLSEAKTGTTPKGWEADEQSGAGEDAESDSDQEEKDDKPEPLDWTIVLIDSNAERASLSLSHDQLLYPQIQAITRRAGFLDDTDPAEVLFRRYTFALGDFAATNPAFNPVQLRRICFVFDRSPKGAIVLDNIALNRF